MTVGTSASDRSSRGGGLLFLNHFGGVSGAERSMLELASALREASAAVTLCTPGGGELQAAALQRGLPFRELPSLLLTHRRSLVWNLGALRRAAVEYGRVLRGVSPDLIVANSVQAAILAGLVPPVLGRKPVIWHYRYDFPASKANRLLVGLASWRVRRLVLISPGMIQGIRSLGVSAEKLVVVRNAVNLARFGPLPATERAPIRVRYGVSEPGTKVIVAVGQICERKNQADMLRALARLKLEGTDCRLWLIGAPLEEDGAAYERSLHELAEELGVVGEVLFAGQVEDTRAVLAAGDVLLHAARSEAFGRVLVEAMACELPVVASDTVGAREIVVSGVTGYLYQEGDLLSMLGALREVLASSAHGAELGRAGRKRALEQFGVERLAVEFGGLAERVAGRTLLGANNAPGASRNASVVG